jgi:hypothetical protein
VYVCLGDAGLLVLVVGGRGPALAALIAQQHEGGVLEEGPAGVGCHVGVDFDAGHLVGAEPVSK